MITLQYPQFNFRIKEEDGKEWIFDEFRKQWVRLTPEEWVRQNMLQYLVQIKKYPSSLIAIEKEIAVGEMRKRFDILVYKNAVPWMIIECKEMNVALNDAVGGNEMLNAGDRAYIVACEQHLGIAVNAGDVGEVHGKPQMGFAPGIARDGEDQCSEQHEGAQYDQGRHGGILLVFHGLEE